MIENLHTFGNPVLLSSSKVILACSGVCLIVGRSTLGAFLAPLSIVLLKAASEVTTTKNTEKWMIISLLASTSNIASLLCLVIASATNGSSNNNNNNFVFSYKFWIFGIVSQKVCAGTLFYYLYNDIKSFSSLLELGESDEDDEDTVHYVELRVTIKQGRDLVAKDTNIFGRHTTSDPYCKVYHGPNKLGKTAIIKKTLDPVWHNEIFNLKVVPRALDVYKNIECNIYDHDKLSSDDPMGTVYVPIPKYGNQKVGEWYKVEKGEGDSYCKNPKGHLFVEIEVLSQLNKSFKRQLLKTVSRRSIMSENELDESIHKHKRNQNQPQRLRRAGGRKPTSNYSKGGDPVDMSTKSAPAALMMTSTTNTNTSTSRPLSSSPTSKSSSSRVKRSISPLSSKVKGSISPLSKVSKAA